MTAPMYVLDPLDPRAPSMEQWASMSEAERRWTVDQLPSEYRRETAPEGDPHREPKEKALEALREFFRRLGRSVYLSAELPVYYPGERVFAPDVIAVLDTDPRPRLRWVVAAENRGLDFALEITLSGDRKKDLEENVQRFARLGIPEYFILDLKMNRILGYRLAQTGCYEPIVPQTGRWASEVLGVDLAMELGRIRFFVGSAPLPQSEELIARLDGMVTELVEKERDLARELDAMTTKAEEESARAEEEKARAEEEKARADRAEAEAARLAAKLKAMGIEKD